MPPLPSTKAALSAFWARPENASLCKLVADFAPDAVFTKRPTAPPATPTPPKDAPTIKLVVNKNDTLQHPGVIVGKSELLNLWDADKRKGPLRAKAIDALLKSLPATPRAPGAKETVVLGAGSGWDRGMSDDFDLLRKYVLAFEVTGDEKYAVAAMTFVKAWCFSIVKKVTHADNEAYEFWSLVLGWCVPSFADAVDILKYTYTKWTATDTEMVEAFALKLLPMIRGNSMIDTSRPADKQRAAFLRTGRIDAYQHFFNNWHGTAAQAWAALGVMLDDPFELRGALMVFRRMMDGRSDSKDSTKNDAYVKTDPKFLLDAKRDFGVTDEIGRDPWHYGAGLAALYYLAETAWHQGYDAYSYKNNVLLASMEMACRFTNESSKTPPARITVPDYNARPVDATRTMTYNVDGNPSTKWYLMHGFLELPYHHYVKRAKRVAPESREVLLKNRYRVPESRTFSWAYGTLTHAQETR